MFNSFIIDRHKKTRSQTFNKRKDMPDIYDIICKMQCPSNQTNVFPMQDRIVAIGDIHGDFESLIYLLYTAKLINNELKWIGGDTFVVQTGDIFDDKRPEFPEEYKPHEPYDELLIIESTKKSYDDWTASKIDPNIYMGIQIKWYIAGIVDNIFNFNLKIINSQINMPGLRNLLTDPLQYYTTTNQIIPTNINSPINSTS